MSSTADRSPAQPPAFSRSGAAVLRAEQWVAVTLLVLVLGLTFVQVVARFVFDSPFFWTEEAARFGYVWLTFLAAMAAMADRSHISVQLGEARLPAWARLGLNIGAMVAVVAACAVMLAGSWPWLGKNTAGASAALHLPNIVFYGVVWVAFAAMAVHALANIVVLVREHRADSLGTAQPGGSAL